LYTQSPDFARLLSMALRKSSLPPGWHPQSAEGIARFLSGIAAGSGAARAVVAPHAGWAYSGKIAARALARLDRGIDALAILGGHLPSGREPLFAMEGAAWTPLGPMRIDAELREELIRETGGREDRGRDNTVEALLPMARSFFPGAALLWMRLPDDPSSFEAGKALAAAAQRLGRRIAAVASADLTHYGSGYGFAPAGSGAAALRWAREENDRRFIEAVESGDPEAVLERARSDRSSCSAGAVACAMGFAQASGLGPARLAEYGTSAGAEEGWEGGSFVSYAALVFGAEPAGPAALSAL